MRVSRSSQTLGARSLCSRSLLEFAPKQCLFFNFILTFTFRRTFPTQVNRRLLLVLFRINASIIRCISYRNRLYNNTSVITTETLCGSDKNVLIALRLLLCVKKCWHIKKTYRINDVLYRSLQRRYRRYLFKFTFLPRHLTRSAI